MTKRKNDHQSEIEAQPHRKLLIQRAKEEDRLPDWGNTCEIICRKGVKAYKKENPHVAP